MAHGSPGGGVGGAVWGGRRLRLSAGEGEGAGDRGADRLVGGGWEEMGVGQNQWYHFGVGAPPILEPILVGIGMFRGSTHGQMAPGSDLPQ